MLRNGAFIPTLDQVYFVTLGTSWGRAVGDLLHAARRLSSGVLQLGQSQHRKRGGSKQSPIAEQALDDGPGNPALYMVDIGANDGGMLDAGNFPAARAAYKDNLYAILTGQQVGHGRVKNGWWWQRSATSWARRASSRAK